ncbi:hypothetical protein N7448_001894 [Penicillium atrosanguineum]|uniref:Uncharacterized protein n=1 Tax=Penicillium atrosanguineum TaxID=1132637 RepID=A0A9W9LDM5_9EURO|nr:uncharacterized protein N7443_005292 [Penicillium atrosanguineum]KAJ5133077.1 hypothetical protein N7526_004442 [Penicillium atrosanguineum]KAJ5150316.1 hypothetical protein N7448_001894 [Penicillium atrosanguineum]KAJ5305632.1 hypothetical protein N7443_005292 [Penicillium atrosanguineum]KAJ5325094.1 hypothetical protein N7476_003694 [Penicillium atrosanguineum]
MYLSAIALAFGAPAVTPVLGNTVEIRLRHDMSLSGSNYVVCLTSLYSAEANPLSDDLEADEADEIPCAGGDVSLDFDGSTYAFRLDGTASMRIEGEASVKTNYGDEINVPDGE